ncbi:transcription antiterminator [Gynuella sunshinyii YC6258]|uniref:Transcription antiterminator n=2 Tax=Gynuella sunshinyii TaxID=1445505 RepID=A0A0C5V482_9GAMM|nr:transcription antiterminator [Gynuella sunshinyii YC6258]
MDYAWYAAYTKYRKELCLIAALAKQGIEGYTPLDQAKMPLFKNYVFVQAMESQLHRLTYLPGFAYLVSFGGQPATIPTTQINALKHLSHLGQAISKQQYTLLPGDHIRVATGPLRGLIGKLVEVKGKHKLVVEISRLDQALIVTLSADQALPIETLIPMPHAGEQHHAE